MPRKLSPSDILGTTHYQLTAEEEISHPVYRWSCSCGGSLISKFSPVKFGNTKSCGCIKKQMLVERNETHGMSKNPAYAQWKGMKKRITNPGDKRHSQYKEKGISIHEDFIHSFPKFLGEIGPKPDGKRWSVGRIDNNGDYTYGNIRWETDEQQARNHGLQKNNKTGICGVGLQRYKGLPHSWVARWKDVCGKNRVKSFLISRYGDDEAKQMAIACRKQEIDKLRSFGVIYADTHGLPNNYRGG